MISIGSEFNGPELRGTPIHRLLTAGAQAVAQARGDFAVGCEPAVNVVFVVPGSLGSCEVDFIREGRFSARDKLLRVEVPVPRKFVESSAATAFIVESLHGANAVGFDFFRRRGGESFALAKAEAIVEEVGEALRKVVV